MGVATGVVRDEWLGSRRAAVRWWAIAEVALVASLLFAVCPALAAATPKPIRLTPGVRSAPGKTTQESPAVAAGQNFAAAQKELAAVEKAEAPGAAGVVSGKWRAIYARYLGAKVRLLLAQADTPSSGRSAVLAFLKTEAQHSRAPRSVLGLFRRYGGVQ